MVILHTYYFMHLRISMNLYDLIHTISYNLLKGLG